MSKKRTAYQRIRDAAKKGTGCHLSADECYRMGALDDAIFTRAQLDDEDDEFERENGRKPVGDERSAR
jgi:hypothetical protein